MLEAHENQSEASNNLLGADDDFVLRQIKRLDSAFEAQGLHSLKSDRSDIHEKYEQKKERLVSQLYELEAENSKLDQKHKEQLKINQELADKI